MILYELQTPTACKSLLEYQVYFSVEAKLYAYVCINTYIDRSVYFYR